MRETTHFGYNKKDEPYFKKFVSRSYHPHKKSSSISWSFQGNYLATAESNIKIWAFQESFGTELSSESRRETDLLQIKFFQSQNLACLTRDLLKIFDMREMLKPVKSFQKSKPDLVTMAWNKNQNQPHFAILTKQGAINLYDIRNMSTLNNPVKSQKNKNDITQLEWDCSGSVLFCGGADGSSSSSSSSFVLYSSILEPLPEIISPHSNKINSIAVSPTNQHMATCSQDSLTLVYSLPQILCERTYSHTDCPIRKVAFSAKGDYLAAGCQQPRIDTVVNKGEQVKIKTEEPCIDIYNVKMGGHAFRLKCGNTQQNLQWHPVKNVLAYLDFDEEDQKKPGSEKEERYLHLWGI